MNNFSANSILYHGFILPRDYKLYDELGKLDWVVKYAKNHIKTDDYSKMLEYADKSNIAINTFGYNEDRAGYFGDYCKQRYCISLKNHTHSTPYVLTNTTHMPGLASFGDLFDPKYNVDPSILKQPSEEELKQFEKDVRQSGIGYQLPQWGLVTSLNESDNINEKIVSENTSTKQENLTAFLNYLVDNHVPKNKLNDIMKDFLLSTNKRNLLDNPQYEKLSRALLNCNLNNDVDIGFNDGYFAYKKLLKSIGYNSNEVDHLISQHKKDVVNDGIVNEYFKPRKIEK